MRIFINRPCPLCMVERDYAVIKSGVRDSHEPNVVKCKCGMVFLNPYMSDNYMLDFYKKDMQRKNIPGIENNNTTKDNARRIKFIKSIASGDSKILDFGAGTGEFVRQMSGFDIEGIDISAEKIDKSIINIHNASIFEWGKRYDIITAFHTLEHIVELNKVIGRLHDMLNDKGMLVGEIPNHDDFLLKNKSFAEFYYQMAHYTYFNKFSIKTAFSRFKHIECTSAKIFSRKSCPLVV